jgi:small subunit ribosomal protein S9
MSTDHPEQPVEETNEPAVPEPEAVADDDIPATETTAPEEISPEPETEGETMPLDIGSQAGVAEAVEVESDPVVRGKKDKFDVSMGTGRRKTAVARVRLKEGNGKISINGRTIEDFFPIERDRNQILQVLESTETLGKVDVWVRVNGGGTTGQTGAVVLGIARALHVLDPSLHHILTDHGFLTRDSRMVERKKYGFKKARKSFQFSKR